MCRHPIDDDEVTSAVRVLHVDDRGIASCGGRREIVDGLVRCRVRRVDTLALHHVGEIVHLCAVDGVVSTAMILRLRAHRCLSWISAGFRMNDHAAGGHAAAHRFFLGVRRLCGRRGSGRAGVGAARRPATATGRRLRLPAARSARRRTAATTTTAARAACAAGVGTRTDGDRLVEKAGAAGDPGHAQLDQHDGRAHHQKTRACGVEADHLFQGAGFVAVTLFEARAHRADGRAVELGPHRRIDDPLGDVGNHRVGDGQRAGCGRREAHAHGARRHHVVGLLRDGVHAQGGDFGHGLAQRVMGAPAAPVLWPSDCCLHATGVAVVLPQADEAGAGLACKDAR